MTEAGRHVLCIVEAAQWTGIGESDVYTVAYRDLAAVVRDGPLTARQPSREDLVGHLRVMEQLMASQTVIPVAYGTVAATEDAVRENLLAPHYDDLRASLKRLDGRVELGLKALWKDMGVVFAELVAEQERIRALRESIAAHPEAHTRQEMIELGRMVAEALEAKRRAEGEAILGALSPLAVEVRSGRLLGEKMILNAAFLVDREREAEFDNRVGGLGEAGASRLLFRYVGPVPPFNFVQLQNDDGGSAE
jgi:hypothetical protein